MIARHKYAIKNNRMDQPLARHFIEKSNMVSQLKCMESDLVQKLKHTGNWGLLLKKVGVLLNTQMKCFILIWAK